jgi:polyisoprenoid-binding protein YceI
MSGRRVTSAIHPHRKRALPAPGTYDIDSEHSWIEFVTAQLMLTTVRGRFRDMRGVITIADRPGRSHVEATIGAASVSTGMGERDAHLRGPDFLDAERFPALSFSSIAVAGLGDGSWAVDGRLTIRDVARRVTLNAVFEGRDASAARATGIDFRATTRLNRDDFALGWSGGSDPTAVLVDKLVSIELVVRADARRSV